MICFFFLSFEDETKEEEGEGTQKKKKRKGEDTPSRRPGARPSIWKVQTAWFSLCLCVCVCVLTRWLVFVFFLRVLHFARLFIFWVSVERLGLGFVFVSFSSTRSFFSVTRRRGIGFRRCVLSTLRLVSFSCSVCSSSLRPWKHSNQVLLVHKRISSLIRLLSLVELVLPMHFEQHKVFPSLSFLLVFLFAFYPHTNVHECKSMTRRECVFLFIFIFARVPVFSPDFRSVCSSLRVDIDIMICLSALCECVLGWIGLGFDRYGM